MKSRRVTLAVALIWLATSSQLPADQPPQAVLQPGKEMITISIQGAPRLVYRAQGAPFKPYIKELYTPRGVQVLRDAPHDHLHHHGLMFAVFAAGVDFWAEKEQSGRQVSVELAVRADGAEQGTEGNQIVQHLHWLPPTPKPCLLTERRIIHVHSQPDLEATLLTWHTRLAPAPGPSAVELSGTHYDGLGMRFVESMDQVGRFVWAREEPGPVVRGGERVTRTQWCAYVAPANGKMVTVAIFDHPNNARHPAGMFTMVRPFAYLSATPNVWKAPLRLESGAELDLRYGVALWDGEESRAQIQALYRRWIAR